MASAKIQIYPVDRAHHHRSAVGDGFGCKLMTVPVQAKPHESNQKKS